MIKHVDWVLLRRQKQTLIKQLDRAKSLKDDTTADDFEGILSLIDCIQDEAAECLGEEAVFGKSS